MSFHCIMYKPTRTTWNISSFITRQKSFKYAIKDCEASGGKCSFDDCVAWKEKNDRTKSCSCLKGLRQEQVDELNCAIDWHYYLPLVSVWESCRKHHVDDDL